MNPHQNTAPPDREREARRRRLNLFGFTVQCHGCRAFSLPEVAARCWSDGLCQECRTRIEPGEGDGR